MNDERDLKGIVTKFLLNTCRLRQQLLSLPVVQAAMVCVQAATKHPAEEAEGDRFPLTTGSVAEFYIEPMLIMLSATDVMWLMWHRQHEVMGKYLQRLSFSRAEIVLINSWMPVQQIVYHLLRVFMKTERLTDSADNYGSGRLSNYHIKTLMLWAYELKTRSWWTDNLNLVWN